MMLQRPIFLTRSPLFLFLFFLLFFSSPPPASGQEFTIQSDTLIRHFERSTARDGTDMGGDKIVFPVYEYLRLDYYNDPSRKISFHAYGWGRGDLPDSDYYADATEAELIYGYLEYKPTFQNATLRLGRQPIYTGVATDYIDGLRFASNLGPLFSVSLHGGQPVGYADTSGRSGDLSFGGRVGHHRGSQYEVGLSYQLTRDDSVTVEEFLAADLNLALPADMTFDAYTSINLDTNGLGEQNYALHIKLLETDLKAFFEVFSYEDYFSAASAAPNPFRSFALTANPETLTRYGINAVRPISSSWEVGAKLNSYNYDVKTGTALYAAGLLTWRGESLQQIGAELGYLDAGVIDNDQWLIRLFAYWDQLPANAVLNFISGDIVYSTYKQGFFGEDSSFFTSFGGGKQFLDKRLDLKLSADYSSDPYFDSDLRGMLSLSYHYQN